LKRLKHKSMVCALFFILTLGLGIGWGLTTTTAQESAEYLGSDSKIKYSASLKHEFFYYDDNKSDETVDSRNEISSLPKVEYSPSSMVNIVTSLEFRYDMSDSSRSEVIPREGYIDLFLDSWDFRIGNQVITWGRADGVKPTDQFGRRDIRDVIENRKEEIVAVKGDYYFGDWTLECVWAPYFDENQMPYKEENRWFLFPRRTTINGQTFNLNYHENKSRIPDGIDSGQAGARLTTEYKGWDFGLMYSYSYDRIPTYIEHDLLSIDPQTSNAQIEFTPNYNRIHTFGGDWSTYFSKLGFRGEIAYTQTEGISNEQPEIDDPSYVVLTTGVDYKFTDIIKTWDMSIIFEYLVNVDISDKGLSDQDMRTIGLRRLYRHEHALLFNAELKFTEFTKFNTRAVYDPKQDEYLFQPELTWSPLDGLTVLVGADFLDGETGSIFGFYDSNDRLRTSITYAFSL